MQHGPSSIVQAMFAPGLDQSVTAIRPQQVHPAGGVTCLSHVVAVPEGTWEKVVGKEEGKQEVNLVVMIQNLSQEISHAMVS